MSGHCGLCVCKYMCMQEAGQLPIFMSASNPERKYCSPWIVKKVTSAVVVIQFLCTAVFFIRSLVRRGS